MITKIEIIEFPAFDVTGISVRTINQDGQSKKDLIALWTRFMTDNILQQIDNKVSNDIYCVYTGYESDHTSCYTALLGCKVKSLDHVQEGFTGLSIPAAKYQVYSLAGKPHESILQAWQEIWDSDVNRAYTVDFDLYAANTQSAEETEAKIYLAVK